MFRKVLPDTCRCLGLGLIEARILLLVTFLNSVSLAALPREFILMVVRVRASVVYRDSR